MIKKLATQVVNLATGIDLKPQWRRLRRLRELLLAILMLILIIFNNIFISAFLSLGPYLLTFNQQNRPKNEAEESTLVITISR